MSKRMRDADGYLLFRAYVQSNGHECAIDIRAPSSQDAATAARIMFPSANLVTVKEAP
jgi:hypothetical protein